MRRATAGHYTHSEPRLRQQLGQLFHGLPDPGLVPQLVVAPHGSLDASGQVAAKVYNAIDFSQFRNAVVLGAKHRDIGPDIAVSLEPWETPLGRTDIDRMFTDQLVTKDLAEQSEQAHRHETSIEMQLLMLQYCWDDFDLAPVLIDNEVDDDTFNDLVAGIKDALNPSDLLIVGTDLVRAGRKYYTVGDDHPEQEVEQADRQFIELLDRQDQEDIGAFGREHHVCGWRPLQAGMAARDLDLFHRLGHTTSFKSDSDERTITGYGGFCYT
ncbi:MAG: AmmeMemoRadiSam system protein B [Candidatus Nanohaloarchaea archaeon]|nr:AmmeMemoRadiSam system protein B [Candidatus Nanohaloarchaea archaeon]